MTDIFNGLSSMINGVLGGPVRVTPPNAPPYDLHAIFREDPLEAIAENGSAVMTQLATLEVPGNMVGTLMAGDVIDPSNGHQYALGAKQINGSPANDGFVVFELERMS